MHGQHEHRSLTQAEAQRRALDTYGHVDHAPLEAARHHLRRLVDDSESLGGDGRQRARRPDLLRHQIDEIDAVGIEDAAEDQRLEVEEDRSSAAESCRGSAAAALDAVSGSDQGSALGRLAEASGALAGRDPLAPTEARIRSAMADLADLPGIPGHRRDLGG